MALVALVPPLLLLWSQRAAVPGAAPAAEFPFVDNPIVSAGFWTGRLTAIAVMARYLWLIAWPMRLSADYSYAQIPVASGRLQDWFACGAILFVLVGCVVLCRRDRAAAFFGGFALLTFLPASNLLFPTGTIMAERVMYLPSVGIIALVVIAVDRLARRIRRPQILAGVAVAIVAGFAVRTWIRNTDWRDDVSLWTSTVRASPHSFKAHRGLAETLHDGDPKHANIDRVVGEIEQAMAPLDALPAASNDARTYRQAGTYYLEQGDLLRGRSGDDRARPRPQAVQAYERSVSVLRRCLTIIEARSQEPPEGAQGSGRNTAAPAADAYRVWSAAYGRLRAHDKAVDAATRARALEPFNVVGYQQSAAAFLGATRHDDAAVALVTGSLVTADRTLRSELVDLYRQGLDPLGCALVETRDGLAINPTCATVRRHACEATGAAIQIHLRAGRADQAQRLQDSAARQFQCP